jgi:hypothetical protein
MDEGSVRRGARKRLHAARHDTYPDHAVTAVWGVYGALWSCGGRSGVGFEGEACGLHRHRIDKD